MPSIYLPRLTTSIIALLLVLYGLAVTLKGRYEQAFSETHGIVLSLSASAKFGDGPIFRDVSAPVR
jgi:hypothetical protein